jgi:hypothetical protein
MQHRVYFGKGNQAVVTVPHRDGRPVRVASATYAIFDARFGDSAADHVVVAADTVTTVDPTSTTLTGKAGRNAEDRRAITVTSTAEISVGRSYILASTTGVVELVKVAAVVSATVLLASAELRGDFASGSTLKGVEVSGTFPSVEADDDTNLDGLPFIVVWSFPGFPPVRETIWLERGEEAQLATLDDLKELDPLISLIGGDRHGPELALARAHKDLRTDLLMAGANESDMLLGPIGRDAVIYRAAALIAMQGDDEVARDKAEAFSARYAKLVAAIKVGAEKPQVVALSQASGEKVPSKTAVFISF